MGLIVGMTFCLIMAVYLAIKRRLVLYLESRWLII